MIVGDRGPVVMVSARAAALLAKPLRSLVTDAERRNGGQVDAEIAAIVGEFERVGAEFRRETADRAAEHIGTSEYRSTRDRMPSETLRSMTSKQVARVLDCSPRNVTALAQRRVLPGVVVDGSWRFDPVDVETLVNDRRTHV